MGGGCLFLLYFILSFACVCTFFWVGFLFADDLPSTSTGEYMNHTLPEDDGGYYNTAEVNTVIRVEDLQCVISEKSAGENNMFQSEYRVLSLIS